VIWNKTGLLNGVAPAIALSPRIARDGGTNQRERMTPMIEKHAKANWAGSLKEGAGTIDTESGTLAAAPYTFATRFEGKKGTNPEELIGAAHAGCYAMFLSALMSGAGVAGIRVTATSTVSLDPATEGGPTVKAAHLKVTAKADADADKIRDFAEQAKLGCPISKLLAGSARVTMEVTIG
jgi:osmotically inducible protein OsmC